MTRRRLAVSASIAVGLLSSRAGAQHAGDADRAGASLAGQIGFLVGNQGYADFATGFRAGYTFPFHLYLGGDLTLYVAGTSLFSVAPEAGYDIGVTRSFVIRPYGGLGFVDFPAAFRDNLVFEFYPGCEFLYHVTRGFFLGGDVRIPLVFVPGGNVVGLNLMFTIGYKW
jgi:hypothetical protein